MIGSYCGLKGAVARLGVGGQKKGIWRGGLHSNCSSSKLVVGSPPALRWVREVVSCLSRSSGDDVFCCDYAILTHTNKNKNQLIWKRGSEKFYFFSRTSISLNIQFSWSFTHFKTTFCSVIWILILFDKYSYSKLFCDWTDVTRLSEWKRLSRTNVWPGEQAYIFLA